MSTFDVRYPSEFLNKSASSGLSYLRNHQQRAPLKDSGQLVYNSLPRLKTANKSGPSNLPQARRKLVNSALQNYLKSLNAMTRSIVLETESVEKEHQYDWKIMDEAKRERIVNEHFVPSEVRLQYGQYDSERASSCCSLNSLDHFTSHQDGLIVENSSTHLSQCISNWEEPEAVSSGNSKNVMYTNKWSRIASDMSLSQPLGISSTAESVQPSKFDRLHKIQLSLRSGHKNAIKPRYSSPQKHVLSSHQLGSDGESQRNSDEDYESNPLGFQRNKLRSFSMRSKRAGGGTKNSANFRSSARTTHKIMTIADGDESSDVESCTQHCRTSHYHTYSTSSTNTDFDEEIDMPDNTMLDHMPRKISADETDSNASFQSSNTTDHYRTRGSCRAGKTAMDVILNANSFLDEDAELSASEDSSSTFLAESQDSSFFQSQSRESSDLDSMSLAPSDISKYDEESMLEFSRMTSESLLSFSSYSAQSKSKSNIFRNCKGKRGGSHFRVATSDFADRHTQFKTNMLQRHHLDSSSVVTTRASSPAISVASSISYSTGAESNTNDLPHTPSILSCSLSNPLAVSYTQHNQILRKSISSGYHEHRESGYISSSSSSSSESFPMAEHK